jgi:hypothetical protein
MKKRRNGYYYGLNKCLKELHDMVENAGYDHIKNFGPNFDEWLIWGPNIDEDDVGFFRFIFSEGGERGRCEDAKARREAREKSPDIFFDKQSSEEFDVYCAAARDGRDYIECGGPNLDECLARAPRIKSFNSDEFRYNFVLGAKGAIEDAKARSDAEAALKKTGEVILFPSRRS